MQTGGSVRLFQTPHGLVLFLGLLLALLPSCGESDVPRIQPEDVPCAPYGDNRYAGDFSLQGSDLSLSVSSAAGQCCVLLGSTLAYRLEEISSLSMTLVEESGKETVWFREGGGGADIVGLWETGDGQTLAIDRSGSFSGSNHPSCFEPPSCGSTAPVPRQERALLATLPWVPPLAWLWLLGRRRHSG